MAKRLNKNQKRLYEALKAISVGVLLMEDALNNVEDMTKEEIQLVISAFEEKITEFDIRQIAQEAYDFEGYAQNIISSIDEIINYKE